MNPPDPRFFASAIAVALALAGPGEALAAWPTSPDLNLPVCTAAGTQGLLQSVPDGAGGVILAWADARPAAPGIYVQRVTADGATLWTADGLRIFSPPLGVIDVEDPISPDPRESRLAVAPDGAGGAIIAWKDSVGPGNTDIIAQRVTAAGVVAWNAAGVPMCRAAGRQFKPAIVADGSGGAIVAWQDLRGGTYRVYAQHVGSAGSPAWTLDGVLACDAAEDVENPGWYSLSLAMVPDQQGGAVLTWASTRGIVAQRLGPDGARLWSSSGAVAAAFTRGQSTPSILPDEHQGAFIAWTDYTTGGGAIYAQRVDASGVPRWAPGGTAVVDGGFDSSSPRLASDASGGCIVVWNDNRPYSCWPCNGSLTYAQRLDVNGNALWAAGGVLVSDATRGSGQLYMRYWPDLVADGSGGAFFLYALNLTAGFLEDSDIYVQRIAADGSRVWSGDLPVTTAPGCQFFPVLVQASSDAVIIAWQDARSGGWDLYAQRVPPAPPVTVTFTDIGVTLPSVDGGVAWGDYDNDGDLDVLVGTHVFRNDGGGSFRDSGVDLPAANFTAGSWGDYDHDGDLDLALLGQTGGTPPEIAAIYRNDRAGGFVDIAAGLQGVHYGSVEWGDYDNDGDLDLLLMGDRTHPDGTTEPFSAVYRNDGADRFTDVHASIPAIGWGSAKWGDYDGDGDLDLLMSGDGGTGIYRNDGIGGFVNSGVTLPQLLFSAVAWGDYDADGDLDFVLTGTGPTSRIYRNQGGGVFSDIGASLATVGLGAVAWGDYDNDGDLDLLMNGNPYGGPPPLARVYRNDAGRFVDANVGLPGVLRQGAAWGDYDNDGDLDILMGSHVYRSDGAPANTPPAAPDGPWSIDVVWDMVTLRWSPTQDAQTPGRGLTYNLRVGTTPGGSQICAAMANPANGYRRVPQLGNAQQRTSWTFHLPELSTIYWSVQAVDGALAGSPFSPERYFGPVPVTASLVAIDARADRIAITWHADAMPAPAATVYRRAEGAEWTALGRATPDGGGYLRFEDASVRPGVRYGYRLGIMDGEAEVFVGEVWADVPAPRLALAGVRPNPVGPDAAVTFSLPDASPARLEVLDVSGRRISTREVGSLGPGTHAVSLGAGRTLPPGIYVMRLTQGGHSLTARAVVTR